MPKRAPARDFGQLLRAVIPRGRGRPRGIPLRVSDPAVAAFELSRAGVEGTKVLALLGTLRDGEHPLVDAALERGSTLYQAQLEASLCRVAVSAKGSASSKQLVARNRVGWSLTTQQQEAAEQLEEILHGGLEDARGRFLAMFERYLAKEDGGE